MTEALEFAAEDPKTAEIPDPAPQPVRPALGKWCSYEQATHSDKAVSLKLANVPNDAQWANMQVLYDKIIHPLFEELGFAVPISSFFRAPAVNEAVGGSTSSQHMLGQAVDLDADGQDKTNNLDILKRIRTRYEFDQLILEYPDAQGRPRWCHVSYRLKGKNRKQVLRARYVTVTVNGKKTQKTVYDPI